MRKFFIVYLIYFFTSDVYLCHGGKHNPELRSFNGGVPKQWTSTIVKKNISKKNKSLPQNTPPEVAYKILKRLQSDATIEKKQKRDQGNNVSLKPDVNLEIFSSSSSKSEDEDKTSIRKPFFNIPEYSGTAPMGRSCSCSDIFQKNKNSPFESKSSQPLFDRPKSPLLKNALDSVSLMVICPNDYEFLPIYNSLISDNRFRLYAPLEQLKKILIKDLNLSLISLSLQNEEAVEEEKMIDPIFFFSTQEGQVFCLVVGGERSKTIGVFLGDIKHYFKGLKQVVLGGICGCFNADIELGSVMMPHKCAALKLLYGDLKDPQQGGSYIQFGKLQGKLENWIESQTNVFYRPIMDALGAFLCYSISTDTFINDKSIGTRLLSFFMNEICIVSMEDHVVWETFRKQQVPVLIIRTVSDHAGMIENNEDEKGNIQSEFASEGKQKACENLGYVISQTIILYFQSQSLPQELPRPPSPLLSSISFGKGLPHNL